MSGKTARGGKVPPLTNTSANASRSPPVANTSANASRPPPRANTSATASHWPPLANTTANASREQASKNSPVMLPADDEDELPLAWHKVSKMLLQSFNERFDKFEQSFQSILAAQREMSERLTTTEDQAADHELRINAMETSVTKLQQENKKLRAKLSDLEGRSRRNNIRIIGVPEGEERGRPTEFVSNLIPKLLGDDNFTKPVVIDRAHRTQQPKPPEGSRPRMIIARVHRTQEKEKIRRLGRQSPMEYEGNRILIFPDYTAEVMEQRRGFREVLQLLREKGVRHSLRFPARLHIHHQGQVKAFDDPDEAKTFVNQKL